MSHTIQHALVLGGTGFLGSGIVAESLRQGIRVTCLVHTTPFSDTLLSSSVRFLNGSLSDFDWSVLDMDRPDIIYHCARIAGRRKVGRILAASEGKRANQRLVDWLASAPTPPRLVYMAGTLAYGSGVEHTVTEDQEHHPIAYAREYTVAEEPFLQAIPRVPIMIMRAPWVYARDSWFRRFYLEVMKRRKFVPQYGDGKNWMSLIHLEDLARMVLFVSQEGNFGQSYNLFCGESIQQSQFLQTLSDITSLPIRNIPDWKVRFRYGQGALEALKFSLKVGTKYRELYRNFQFRYPDLAEGLKRLLRRQPPRNDNFL